MSNIKPFKAVYYNPEKVNDFSKVVSPPYDVISAEEQAFLHKLSPYNFTHIDLADDLPGDNKENNKYSRAKKAFQAWLQEAILIQDDSPSIYFYKQEYKMMGQKYSRFGFIATLELAEEGDSKIYPHENTHAHAVDDRFNLTKALDAQLSCIFVCFADKQKVVDNIFNRKVLSSKPIIDVEDQDHIKHTLWRLSDPDLIKEIQDSLKGQQMFIADGHHRFKMAMEYKKYCLAKKAKPTGQESFNYVMTYFTNIDSKDLKIFPMHRIIKRMPDKISFLEEYFRIDKIRNIEDLVILLAQAGKNENAFGLYTKDGVKMLRLKNKKLIEEVVKEGSKDYKELDAAILKYFIFDKIGIKSDDIIYTKDMDSAKVMVDNNQAEAVFVMNPVKVSQLKAIALNGEKMPPKTTYFYPKVLSGLTIHKLD